MNMPNCPLSSEKSLEELLSECVEKLERREISSPLGAATGPASRFFSFESPNRGNEPSQKLLDETVLKCNAPRASHQKMSPRQGAISKHRQQRQTSKGNVKTYVADLSNFKALVKEHTCKLSSSPPPDVAGQPSSPLSPHSITSASSLWGFTSQPSSPATPHSIQSTSTSPLSSPHQGPGSFVNPFYPPFKSQTRPPRDTHLNVPYSLPSLCNDNQNLIADHNADIYQPTNVPRSVSTPCLGISTEVDIISSDNGRQHGMSPATYARALSLRRYLLDDDAVCDENCM